MAYYVYILTSRKRGTLYIGVTNNIARRVWEHRQGRAPLALTKKLSSRPSEQREREPGPMAEAGRRAQTPVQFT